MISLPMLLLSIISLILANQLASVNSQHTCGNNGNYTTDSIYQSNLNTLLPSLSTNIDQNGFYNASTGENPDTVYALGLCRGDQQLDVCRGCIHNATVDLVALCPNQRQATYWSPSCMLRYSDASMFGILATSPPGFNVYALANVSNPDTFNANLTTLLRSLWTQAAQGGPLRKVAAGNLSTYDFNYIYGLVQCTPDLTSDDCANCLMDAAHRLSDCCDSSTGARVISPSCSLFYDMTPFYNLSRLLELAQNPAPPPSSTLPTPPTPPTPRTPIPGKGRQATHQTTIVVVASVSACLTLLILVGYLLRKRRKQKRNEKPESEAVDDNNFVESLHYEFDKVRAATNGFSEANKLGQGGFGPVYKGKLPNGREIAVKRLSSDSCQGDMEFKNEVKLLAMLQHKNLVRLIGFSMIRTEKLLLYEFLQNSSLDKFIFDPKRCLDLNWDKRYKIIRGIAKGLLYLHEDARLRIIHRDLKASNVLLDEDMNPKIADFGTARLFVLDETRANTARVVGTFGYMPPEYALHGQFSVKSDVYSFGVLILEIISGQRNNCFKNEENGVDLLTRVAWKNWHEGTDLKVVDPFLRSSSGIPREILRCIHIGLLCVQQNAADRPTMVSVVLMLNRFSTTLPLPSEPAFFVANDYDLEDSISI